MTQARSNMSRGYKHLVGAGVRFQAAKRDVWRLLIVIDRMRGALPDNHLAEQLSADDEPKEPA